MISSKSNFSSGVVFISSEERTCQGSEGQYCSNAASEDIVTEFVIGRPTYLIFLMSRNIFFAEAWCGSGIFMIIAVASINRF